MFKSALVKKVFFDALTEEEVLRIDQKSTNTVYESKQVVFYEERMPYGIFILLSG